MVCAAVCLSHATTSTWFSVLHPIERDGDGGFFYACDPQNPLGGCSLLHSIARVTRKECAYGRYS